MDNKSFTLELEQMITKGLIDQNYKILIMENRQKNTEPSPDKISFTIADRNTDQENAITNESLPFIVSQDTPVIKSKSTTTCKNIENADESLTFVNSQTKPVIKATPDTSCDMRKSPTALEVDILRANMMAIKSFFMNEIYLRQEISSLKLKLQQEKLNQSGYNNICEKDEKIIIEELKTKLDLYQRENQLLKDETIAKQRTIETTSADICDYIKPELRHKPDVIIIHCGTNYTENEINTVKKIKKLVKEIDEYDKQNPPKVVISRLIKRYDKDFNDDIANINEKLQRFCNGKGLSFIDNNNIDRSCLNKGKLHLNRRGSSYSANNFKKYVGSL